MVSKKKLDNLTPFKKGQSGNPKGRPPKLPHLDKLLDSVLGKETNNITEAEKILIALKKRAFHGDVRAAEVLLERAYGKAKQDVNLTGDLNLTTKKVVFK